MVDRSCYHTTDNIDVLELFCREIQTNLYINKTTKNMHRTYCVNYRLINYKYGAPFKSKIFVYGYSYLFKTNHAYLRKNILI